MTVETPMDRVIGYPLKVSSDVFSVTALQMGNPQCCILLEDFESLDWRRIGRLIEKHSQFPDRTNVVFVHVLARDLIELRIWERGVGETSASGTCSCAGAVAAMVNEKVDRDVSVIMPGGKVRIVWRDDDEVVITGSAEVVYRGEWLSESAPGQ
jgi:diaminopimelate epimerase